MPVADARVVWSDLQPPHEPLEHIVVSIDTSVPSALPTTDFAALGVTPALVRALHRQGITDPTPVQAAVIPDALAGHDVLARARTDSGTTLA